MGSARNLGPHLALWFRDPGSSFWVHKYTRGRGGVLQGGALHKQDALGKPGLGRVLEGSGAVPEARGGQALPCFPGFLSCRLKAAILIKGMQTVNTKEKDLF